MVRVGDDSLTIDKCRRSGQTGAVAPSALFYKSGQIAEGFRIYVANDGQIVRVSTFDILFPISIKVAYAIGASLKNIRKF